MYAWSNESCQTGKVTLPGMLGICLGSFGQCVCVTALEEGVATEYTSLGAIVRDLNQVPKYTRFHVWRSFLYICRLTLCHYLIIVLASFVLCEVFFLLYRKWNEKVCSFSVSSCLILSDINCIKACLFFYTPACWLPQNSLSTFCVHFVSWLRKVLHQLFC